MGSLEVVKVVIFIGKINDFEESTTIQSLRITPPFGPPMRPQKPLKMRPKSTSEGYQIKLLFEKAFKNASDSDFDSKITPKPPPQSRPKQLQKLSPPPFDTILQFRSILDHFGIDFRPH